MTPSVLRELARLLEVDGVNSKQIVHDRLIALAEKEEKEAHDENTNYISELGHAEFVDIPH
jgi:hypothetical protein